MNIIQLSVMQNKTIFKFFTFIFLYIRKADRGFL